MPLNLLNLSALDAVFRLRTSNQFIIIVSFTLHPDGNGLYMLLLFFFNITNHKWLCKFRRLITPGMEFKLFNETLPGSGRVMFEVDGTLGTVCILGRPKGIHDPLASVACRELGYVDGVLLLEGIKHIPKHINIADIYLESIKCVGNESKVRECTYKLLSMHAHPEPFTCDWNQQYRACSYARVFESAQFVCRNKGLNVRCLTKGEQCCYLSCP